MLKYNIEDRHPGIHSCFEPRPTDVFLVSFPKSGSGTTWLKALAFATLKRSTHPPFDGDHPLRHCNPHDCVKFLESYFNQQKGDVEALPSPRVLATHLPYSLLPGSIAEDGERSGCRIVYVCREPKDVLVSSSLFTRKAAPAMGFEERSFTIQEALELFCDGRCVCGPQWEHVLQYWEESVRRPGSVLFFRYEEMLIEPEAVCCSSGMRRC
ncbi:cytosolic sulfotransferase 12-like [Zea mays]|jgi:hydroxyjasmonate sulfotransferase|nr:cytosolic sulfotransferase 12-like [Zea mays]|eukprot:XP_008674545.1 cytosolic sulfotransferase 12-like [Zea mays]